MLQTNTIDLTAIAAQRTAASQAARKPQADFGAFFDQAQTADSVRPSQQEAQRPNVPSDSSSTNADGPQAASTDQTQQTQDRADQDNQADQIRQDQARSDQARADQTRADQRAADQRADAARADQTAASDQDGTDPSGTQSADGTSPTSSGTPAAKPATGKDASQAAKPADGTDPTQQIQAQLPADPHAALALMLATGAQLVLPTAHVAPGTTPNAGAAQGQTAVAAVAPDGKPLSPQDAMAKALAAAQAGQAAQPAQATQANATGAKTATPQGTPQEGQRQAQAQTSGVSQLQDLLARAAGNLGPIKVQVENGVVKGGAATADPKDAELPADLSIDAQGPTAPVTLLDGAKGTGMTAQVMDLIDTPSDALQAPKDDTPLPDAANLVAPAHTAPTDTKLTLDVAPAAKDAPPDVHEVMKQVLDRADQIKANQAQTIKLQLMPEHLGKLEIHVTSHEGVVSAQISADNQHVKSMLDGQVAMLQRTFADMGLKVDRVEVTLSSADLGNTFANGGQAFPDGQQGQQGQTGNPFQQAPRQGAGLGYEQWLPDTPQADAYVVSDRDAAVDYVA